MGTRDFVYLAKRTDQPDWIKVGISGNTRKRMTELSRSIGATVYAVYDRAFGSTRAEAIERLAHLLLSNHRVGGEWFNASLLTARSALAWSIIAHRNGHRHCDHARKVPLATLVSQDIRDAVILEAHREGTSAARLVERILREALAPKKKGRGQ